jgi:hypothetical protein
LKLYLFIRVSVMVLGSLELMARSSCTMHKDEGRKMWLMCCKSCD